ncbi:type III restriction endonuclease subunit M [Staphylococcus equorum]|nr:type III restriction endonuclease subunit M [Staphylococcus equorum]
MKTKINEAIKQVLQQFDQKYFIGEVLNKNKVIQDLDTYDKDLLKAFISNETLKSNFTIDIAGNIVMQTNKLIELFEADEYWQDSYTKYSKKIGLTTGGKFIDESTDVVLDFPYKDTVLKASMSKEDTEKDDLRPDEPFLNEVIAKEEIDILLDKKILVNAKKYDENGENEVDSFSENDNLILKGNNLLALHTLKDNYAGKVKLIYIDPPYNTGSDSFAYNDKFNHSAWLTFMKNRLDIAREMLTDDGVIYLSIDDKEQAYLKVLMDAIFGRNNFLTQFNFQVRYADKSLAEAKAFKPVIEYTLMYAKDSNIFIPNRPTESYTDDKFIWRINELSKGKIETINGNQVEIFQKGQWELVKGAPDVNALKETWISGSIYSKMSYGQVYQSIIEPRVEIDGNGALYKIYGRGEDGLGYRYYTNPLKANANRGKMYSGMPLDRKREIENGESLKLLPIVNFSDFAADFGNIRHEGGVTLNSGKKPEKLLKLLFEYGSKENELILDFFMGSGSTQATAMKMNRRFIGMEQIDDQWNKAVKRLKNVVNNDQTGISKDVDWQGGGSFVYAELMEKNLGFLKSIQEADNRNEINKIFNFMLKEAEIDFRIDLEVLKDTFHELSLDDQKKTLIKIIDKNQLYYNYSEIDDEYVRDLISDGDYAFNKNFYDKGGE